MTGANKSASGSAAGGELLLTITFVESIYVAETLMIHAVVTHCPTEAFDEENHLAFSLECWTNRLVRCQYHTALQALS